MDVFCRKNRLAKHILGKQDFLVSKVSLEEAHIHTYLSLYA